MTTQVFNWRNVDIPCLVFDIVNGTEIKQVSSVDLNKATLTIYEGLPQILNGEIDAFEMRFKSIHPIYGKSARPVSFHCYHRID